MGAGEQGRGAGEQGSRGIGEQGNRERGAGSGEAGEQGAGERGSGGAGEQGAGEQGSGGAGERGSRERGAWEQGEGEQGAGELCEAARPGLTLPAQGCVRLREAARRQGLAAWPGRRHSTYTGGGRVGCMQGAREPATTSSPCRRDMCPYLGCWGATAGLGSSSPLLLRLQGLQRRPSLIRNTTVNTVFTITHLYGK